MSQSCLLLTQSRHATGQNRIPLEPCRSLTLTASSLNSQTASAASSSERINLMMRRRITADIQRSQRGFTLGLMTPMAFSIRRVAPSPRCVYRHVLCHQSAQHAVRRVAPSPRCVYPHILCHQSAQHAVDPCRDTVARSQVLFRARRSTSTRTVRCSLVAACQLLPVIIAESAGYAG